MHTLSAKAKWVPNSEIKMFLIIAFAQIKHNTRHRWLPKLDPPERFGVVPTAASFYVETTDGLESDMHISAVGKGSKCYRAE